MSFHIPDRPLVGSEAFGKGLPAGWVAAAIGRGLQAGGLLAPDLCPLDSEATQAGGTAQIKELLQGLDFEARMRRARAVIIAVERLRESTLAGSMMFEIATLARQGGVPAYAVCAENALDGFDARILDLQLILQATTARGLTAAGRKLARVV